MRKGLTKEPAMKNTKNFIMMIFTTLIFNTACVVTPNGDFVSSPVSGGFDVRPEVVFGSRSFVNVRIGPDYFVDDAFALAYDHCQRFGFYPLATSNWARSSFEFRELRYSCGSRFVAPPLVLYRDRPYFHTNHRGYHGRHHWNRHDNRPSRPNSGWWGRNNAPSQNTNVDPDRRTTGQSPWSYNRNKDSRYQSPRGSSSRPVQNNTTPGWWGRNRPSSSSNINNSDSNITPRATTGSSSWFKKDKPKYESYSKPNEDRVSNSSTWYKKPNIETKTDSEVSRPQSSGGSSPWFSGSKSGSSSSRSSSSSSWSDSAVKKENSFSSPSSSKGSGASPKWWGK